MLYLKNFRVWYYNVNPTESILSSISISHCQSKILSVHVEINGQVTIGPNQIRPHNFVAALKNIYFKGVLVNFFNDYDEMAPNIGNEIIYSNFNKCYSYRVENSKVIKTVEHSLSWEEHEEGDSRIIYHICQMNVDSEVVIRCSQIFQ